jgi:predicted transglutaminase-like cysteine proteinase
MTSIPVLAATAIAALLSQPVQAQPLARLFCNQHAAICQGHGPDRIGLDGGTLALLQAVNSRVNGSIIYTRERVDRWSLAASRGDCEDYALTKRAELMAVGFPSNALRLALGYTENGTAHAILVVRTLSGDLALDNIRKTIVPVAASGLRVIRMSGGDLREWSKHHQNR